MSANTDFPLWLYVGIFTFLLGSYFEWARWFQGFVFLSLVAHFVGEFIKGRKVIYSGGVLITGTSSGIGESSALYLAKRGFTIFACVRKLDDGAKLKSRAGEFKENIVPIEMEVDKEDSIQKGFKNVESWLKNHPKVKLVGCVNNAGIGGLGPLEITPMESFKKVMDVNFFGTVLVTRQVVPWLRRNGCGRVINISSLLGIVALPNLSSYCASKHAMEAFSDCLRNELYRFNIKVVIIEPGYIKTALSRNEKNQNKGIFDDLEDETKTAYSKYLRIAKAKDEGTIKSGVETGIDAEQVAEVVYNAMTVRQPKDRYIVGAAKDAQLVMLVKRLPNWFSDPIAQARD